MAKEITRIIEAVSAGQACATTDLLPMVYEDLKRLANIRMSREFGYHTLQPTALVHEAYMRLVGTNSDTWENRAHFFAAAAQAMRRILIDYARSKKSRVRAQGAIDPSFLDGFDGGSKANGCAATAESLLALDVAISEFEKIEPQKAELVSLKFFGGMTLKEAARILDIPPRTADRLWAYSRAWLHERMKNM